MSVKELYESFGGDYNRAVQTMMNDACVTRMLSKFVANNSYSDMINAYKEGNLRTVFEAAHSLKGVSGNLALTPLYEKASVICEKTRNLKENESVNLDIEIKDFEETYNSIVSSINNLIA